MNRTTDSPPPIRAICYHRVGSGVITDQEAVIVHQAARVAQVAERLKLQVVGIYTDFAVARSTSWLARPAARRLTAALTDRSVTADVVLVDDPLHAIGADHLAAALAALPIPLCRPGADGIAAVTADHAIDQILSGLAPRHPARSRRCSRPYPARQARDR